MKKNTIALVFLATSLVVSSSGCNSSKEKTLDESVLVTTESKEKNDKNSEAFKQDIYIETYHANYDIYTGEGANSAIFTILSKEKLKKSDVEIQTDTNVQYDTVFGKSWDMDEQMLQQMPSKLLEQYGKYKKYNTGEVPIYAYEVGIGVKGEVDEDETIKKLDLIVKGKKYKVEGIQIRVHNGSISKKDYGTALNTKTLISNEVVMYKDAKGRFAIPDVELLVSKDVILEKVVIADRKDVSVEDVSINIKKGKNKIKRKLDGEIALKKNEKAVLKIRLKDNRIGNHSSYASNYGVLIYYKYKGKEYAIPYQVFMKTKRTKFELFAEKNDGLDLTEYYKNQDRDGMES